MKLIFLDVDGVLNCNTSTSRCKGMLGVDSDKVARLARIVHESSAKIVLISTWKLDWYRTSNEKELPWLGKYLVSELAKYNVQIHDKTIDEQVSHRGEGINNWMNNQSETIESFVILDDDSFDYKYQGLSMYHVKTSFYHDGLQDCHVEKAIKLLNGGNKA